MDNKAIIKFSAKSENESFARSAVACFALQLNPTLAEISDIKTAVSEAVTNAIVHGYPNTEGEIQLETIINDNKLHINIFDNGVGIDDLEKALQPFYTTKPEEERSGMGFTIMKSFMDEVRVESTKGCGTKIFMMKTLKPSIDEAK
jgi:stage II sporulation protein AB (anti-sigma F factor)